MNVKDLEKMREQIKALYKKKREELDAQEAAALQSLDVLEKLSPELSPTIPSTTLVSTENGKSGTLIDAVKSILPDLIGPFDINNVISLLEQKYSDLPRLNPTSISGILRELYEADVIERLEKGQGKRPSIYKLKASL